ncbi:MAG: DUF1585 domain-containing protein, partial [Planctomycetota bacterium]|nr:DUF1585 domain-containing protein [Planctomycetota bacterium]
NLTDPKPGPSTVPIDASVNFRNGTGYRDIVEYRSHLLTHANRDLFIRCFITNLLTCANGAESDASDFVEVDRRLERSAEHDYRIVDIIAAVVDSPLFREE